jgi:hypothetical protein
VTGFLARRRPAGDPQPTQARVLTASGRRINLEAARRAPANGPRVHAWQHDAWEYRDTIGEVRYAIGYLRHAVSRVRVFPAVAEPDGAEPTPLDQADGVPAGVLSAAEDALARLTAGTNDWAALLAPYAENFEIPGEAWLVGRPDPDALGSDVAADEVWQIRSSQEIEAKDRGWTVRDVPDDHTGTPLEAATAYVARLWQPHARWRGLTDSPMRALLGVCEELQLVTRMIRGASRSRMAGAGLLLVPDDISFRADGLGESDPEDPEADDFFASLTRAMMTAIEDEADASSVVPILVKAAAESLKEVRHVPISVGVDDKLLARIEPALRRIGAGLDVPPEIVTGMADVNHWTAWQVDASTIKMHVEPLLIEMLGALTSGYLRHALVEYGVPPEWARKVINWYDVAPLTIRQNRAEDARVAHERLVISDRALVEALGFDVDTDMPDEEELARRVALVRGTVDAPMMDMLLRMLVLKDLPERPPPIAIAPPPPAPDEDDEDAPAGSTPGPDTGLPIAAAGPPSRVLRAYPRESARLARLDTDTRERLTVAADAALARALERAQARVASQANRTASARGIVAAALPGRAYPALAQAGLTAGLGLDPETLLAGAWDQLRESWDQLTWAARNGALELAARVAGHDPQDPAVSAALDQAAARLTELADAGWAWWAAGLTALAVSALTDPDSVDGVAEEPGEDPGRRGRLTTLTRGALAVAGGLPADHPGVGRDGLPVSGGVRVPGIASGDVVSSYLRGAGRSVLAYEWVYGISRVHFEPHRALDGLVFTDFDSGVLANPSSWPYPTLAPGDHRGCHCDAQPVWADASRSSDDLDAVGDATFDPTYRRVLEEIAASDRAAGRLDTTPIETIAEAERIDRHRPSRRP